MKKNVTRLAGCVIPLLVAVCSSWSQSPPPSNSPNLTEPFTFRLDRYQDRRVRELVDRLTQQSEGQRLLELHAAQQPLFERTIDLLRFVPFKMRTSDINGGDFLTPNYLRADYNRPTPDSHLFDSR